MAKVNFIEIVDSGRYYSTAPRILIDPPEYDSERFGGTLDSNFMKFGSASLKHDSNDVTILDPLTDSGTGLFKFVSQSFWFYLDSLKPCTLTWSENFRVFVGNNQKLNIAFTVDSTNKDAFQTNNVQVRDTSSHFVQAQKWHFAKIETNQNAAGQQANLRIGLDSAYTGTYAVNMKNLYDSGSVIRIGYDSGYTGPEHLENIGGQYVTDSDINRSFVGNIDNFQFTIDSDKQIYNNQFSNWRPDSAEATYEGLIPMIHETFDFTRAKGRAVLDSFGGIDYIQLTDSGDGYTSQPDVYIFGGQANDSDFAVGDTVEQTLSNNVKITGEIQHIKLDSAGDSSITYSLAHVGADDGKLHSFIEKTVLPPFTGDGILINKTNNSVTGLIVNNVVEDNKISNTEQNTTFSDESDDFLDFSENNPFGDPENQ